MWAKLGQLLITNLLKPLIEKSVVALFKWLKNWNEKRKELKKRKIETDKKLKDYEDAKTENDVRDTFSDMP